ncbi:TerY-C metal binding domain-containing protein [Granulosicoccus antarcticus]|uniref:VWFA domain-containing protein n=1 Tax=Granulosicoccus antarcticus IMCC3135 TaxID=1192854 RepID=A0A2Z2NI50_9GAMM|nr:TerY-C metal binding domain-containing protein [Granulosicoccus antarcticus]ASJ70733.1 hypothetical protein IMCC3135_03100 [Granulosicoccus antarcticus IMCC3135]
MRKFPIYLLVDVSESMAGDALTQLENGMRQITADLMQDPHALETAYLSVIAFAGRARTLTPLTELVEFVPPHLPVGGGTGLGCALMHLMDEIDNNVTPGSPERKGDWKPLVFLITDGVPTDDVEPAMRRWQDNYAHRVAIVAVSIGGGGDHNILSRLTDDIIPFDDTVDGAFKKFITWITNSVKSSTRSVTTGGGITLSKLGDDVSGRSLSGMPFEAVDDRYAVFVGRCTENKAPYVVKYERHMNRMNTQVPQLEELFKTRDYLLKAAVPVQQDYFELCDGEKTDASVSSTQLIGQPDCPHCHAQFGMAVCACGGIHCVKGDGFSVCPWCTEVGNYGSSGKSDDGFDIGRGRG